MASLVRPSLIIRMDVDERLYSQDVVDTINRSYAYTAPSMVKTHAADGDVATNNMRFIIKLHRPYWDVKDPAAQELWQGVMPKWLRNMFYKVSNTITASKEVAIKHDAAWLDYAWLELEFGENLIMAVKTAADSTVPEDAVALVERVREAAVQGVFGEGVARVSMPSRESWEAQLAAAAPQVEEEAEAKEAENAFASEAEVKVVTDGEMDAEGESEVELEIEEASAPVEPTAAELSVMLQPAQPAFDINYTVWGIEYADGTVRQFDSVNGQFFA